MKKTAFSSVGGCVVLPVDDFVCQRAPAALELLTNQMVCPATSNDQAASDKSSTAKTSIWLMFLMI